MRKMAWCGKRGAARCSQRGLLVRFADDFVGMCGTESQAREALRRIGLGRDRLDLTLHPAKTQLVDWRRGKESLVFLGGAIRKKRSILWAPSKYYMQRWPSPKATKKLRDRVRELTDARHSGKDVKQIIAELKSRASRLGNLLPDGECRSGVQQAGWLGIPTDAALAASARRPTESTSRALMIKRTLRSSRSAIPQSPATGLWSR